MISDTDGHMTSAAVLPSFPVYNRTCLPLPDEDLNKGAVFLVDKPSEWSSFDVVKFLRNRIRVRKTGHAGTLDPLATGLLILCAGKATKSITTFQDYAKRYRATITFGNSTPSHDAATKPDGQAPVDHLNEARIQRVLENQFQGRISQIPPMYSALWKDGKRLYKYARKGKVVEREPREIEIYETSILKFHYNNLDLDVLCSKGTYIRQLAHDLGLALGTLAYLSDLRRTAIGIFKVEDAMTIDQIRPLSQHDS